MMKKTVLATFFLVSGLAHGAMETVPATNDAQVTLMNWSEQPYNHWAFRNIGIQPSVMVPRGGDISALPTALDARIPKLAFTYQNKPYTVRSAMVGDSTDGYIVIQNGKILAEEYFNGFTESDHHLWASSTKSMVGQAMGLLIEQGKVSEDAKVSTYIPELKNTYFGARTVRDVLNMVSALDYSEDYENFEPGAVSTEYFRRLGFIPAFDLMAADPKTDNTPRSILEYLPQFGPNDNLAPGDRFEYHSPNVDVAGWIIARASGQPLQTFIAENIWSKLSTEHDAFFMTDVGYVAVATGGFNTTLRDFARVGLAIVNNGQYNGNQVFAEKWLKDTFALTDKEREQMNKSVYKDPQSPVYDEWLEGYKNYLWIHDSEKGIATFRGVFGQHLYVNQDKNLVIATFSSAKSASNAARDTNKPRLASFEAIAEQF